jgi:hypothetical protein
MWGAAASLVENLLNIWSISSCVWRTIINPMLKQEKNKTQGQDGSCYLMQCYPTEHTTTAAADHARI